MAFGFVASACVALRVSTMRPSRTTMTTFSCGELPVPAITTPALMTVGGDSCRLPETGIATINARIDADARAAGLRILLSQVNRVPSLMSPNA